MLHFRAFVAQSTGRTFRTLMRFSTLERRGRGTISVGLSSLVWRKSKGWPQKIHPNGTPPGFRKALTFYYCMPHANYCPQWYRRLLEVCPEIVADVQVRFAVSEFRSDRESIYKLWELAPRSGARSSPLSTRVCLCSMPFPTRCKLKQIQALDHLLWAAIQHADRALLQELIERKLSRKSLNVAQRVYWLAAGALVSPAAYKDPLRDFLEGQQSRIRHLPVFLCNDDPVRFSFHELKIPLLELLIRLIGSYAGPNQWSEDGWVTPVMGSRSPCPQTDTMPRHFTPISLQPLRWIPFIPIRPCPTGATYYRRLKMPNE